MDGLNRDTERLTMTDTDDLVKRLLIAQDRVANGEIDLRAIGMLLFGKFDQDLPAAIIVAALREKALTAQLAALRNEAKEVVRPFGEFGQIMLPNDEYDVDDLWVTASDNTQIAGRPDLLFGHFRRAAAFLDKLEDMK